MAKKGSDLKKIFGLVACAALLAGLVMFFFPVLRYQADSTLLKFDVKLAGLVTAFGGKEVKFEGSIAGWGGASTVAIKGSWAGVVAFILVVLSLAAFVGTMVEKKLASKLTLVSAALAIVAGVLVLVALKGAMVSASEADDFLTMSADYLKLTFAGVMSGILLIVSGACNVLTLVNLK